VKNFFAIVFVIFIGLLLYTSALRGEIGNPLVDKGMTKLSKATGPFESSHERAPYALLVSLVERGSFELTQDLANFASPDTVFSGEKYFIIFPPGVSLVAMPFYLLAKEYHLAQLSTYAGMTMFAILNLVLIYLIAKNIFRLSIGYAILSAMVFGFATTSWSFAASLYQHHLTVLLILISYYSVWKYALNMQKWLWTIVPWTVMGLSIWLDYPSVLLLIPVFLYLFLKSLKIYNAKKKLNIIFNFNAYLGILVFFALVGVHLYYNKVNFGSPTVLAQFLKRYDSSKVQDQAVQPPTKQTIEETIKKKSTFSNLFQENRIITGLYTLTVASDKGLFYFSPILILAILGIFTIYRKSNKYRLEAGILISVFLLNLFMYSSWSEPWGGWAFGPRYLIPAMAVMSVFPFIWLDRNNNKIRAKLITFVLFCYSSFISLLGVLTTTATPPKVEAVYLKIKYGFFLNWDYFMDGRSGSFVFNEFVSKHINLQQYFILIYIPLILIVFILLFIVPLLNRKQISKKI